ncbi:MAG: elongation factor P [Patescibacteria group bacterium]|nr:elongation factor P [Patescibacteria group bacterium]
MLSITDLKTGVIFEIAGEPWQVLEQEHSKTGRAGAVLRTKIKNLETGATVGKTFQGSDKFEPVRIERKKAQYLYLDNGLVFMDTETYEQFTLGKEVVGNATNFMKEGDEVQLMLYKGRAIAVELPIKVSLKVTEAPEADKGNTATAATKQITLETGYKLNAPMFVKQGDSIIVDTRDGSYVERAK